MPLSEQLELGLQERESRHGSTVREIGEYLSLLNVIRETLPRAKPNIPAEAARRTRLAADALYQFIQSLSRHDHESSAEDLVKSPRKLPAKPGALQQYLSALRTVLTKHGRARDSGTTGLFRMIDWALEAFEES